MTLQLNIAANYASQFYVALIGILLVPVYIGLMGTEAYGLVAFFTMLQSWFQLLDIGLASTMAREAARYQGGACDTRSLRALLRSLEGFFWLAGLIAAVLFVCGTPVIAAHWLKVRGLPTSVVETSLVVMAFTLALRWVCGLYRSLVTGLERLVWLGGFNAAVATFRFVGVIPLLLIDSGPVTFFLFQAVVSIGEFVVLLMFSYSLLPLPSGVRLRWSWSPLQSMIGFSATVAFTSTVWVFVTQTDKLILSRYLTLGDYGLFTAAVLVASSITLIGAPIAQALLPRLTRLSTEKDEEGLLRVYRQATQAIVAIAGSSAIVLIVFSREVLWVWTGDMQFAQRYSPVLALYALGNAFLASAAFPYYLQYAKGDLRLHLWGNVVFVVLLVPAIILATTKYGPVGAGMVWAVTNALFFLVWTPLVHRRFAPGLHTRWLRDDILRVTALPLICAATWVLVPQLSMSRVAWGAFIVAAASGMIVAALFNCVLLRPELSSILSRFAVLRR